MKPEITVQDEDNLYWQLSDAHKKIMLLANILIDTKDQEQVRRVVQYLERRVRQAKKV